jgi:hypothetical protein
MIEFGSERQLAPHDGGTADIHSRATMLLEKLDPANTENIARITMRSRKRTTT